MTIVYNTIANNELNCKPWIGAVCHIAPHFSQIDGHQTSVVQLPWYRLEVFAMTPINGLCLVRSQLCKTFFEPLHCSSLSVCGLRCKINHVV